MARFVEGQSGSALGSKVLPTLPFGFPGCLPQDQRGEREIGDPLAQPLTLGLLHLHPLCLSACQATEPTLRPFVGQCTCIDGADHVGGALVPRDQHIRLPELGDEFFGVRMLGLVVRLQGPSAVSIIGSLPCAKITRHFNATKSIRQAAIALMHKVQVFGRIFGAGGGVPISMTSRFRRR